MLNGCCTFFWTHIRCMCTIGCFQCAVHSFKNRAGAGEQLGASKARYTMVAQQFENTAGTFTDQVHLRHGMFPIQSAAQNGRHTTCQYKACVWALLDAANVRYKMGVIRVRERAGGCAPLSAHLWLTSGRSPGQFLWVDLESGSSRYKSLEQIFQAHASPKKSLMKSYIFSALPCIDFSGH